MEAKTFARKKKAAIPAGPKFGLAELAEVNRRSIKSAGPRYFPNIAPDFPDMAIESFDKAMEGLTGGEEFRARVEEIAQGIRDAWDKASRKTKRQYPKSLPEPKRVLRALDLLAHADPECVGEAIVRLRQGIATAKKRAETLERRMLRDRKKRDREHGGNIPFSDLERPVSEYGYALNWAEEFLPGTSYPFWTDSGALPVVLPNACGLRENGTLLLHGEWGMGKTHSLCRLTKRQMERGLPVLLALAKDFDPADSPGNALARHAGLAEDFKGLLSRLDALGREVGVRALLLVDGVNERNPDGAWTRALGRMLRQVRQFPFVGLVVSFRVPFRHGLSARAMSETPFMRHVGFEKIPFEAQAAFLEYYGAPLPEVPPMAEEFTRPLTLKLICEVFKKLPKKEQRAGFDGIASGQKGMTFILERCIKERAVAVWKKHRDLRLPAKVFSQAVWTLVKDDAAPHMAKKLTGEMPAAFFVKSVRERLSVDCRKARRILRDMDDEGIVILARSAPWDWNAPNAAESSARKLPRLTVQMPYQMFADHLIARHLLAGHLRIESAEAVRRSFRANAPLGKIFSANKHGLYFRFAGMRDASELCDASELAEALILEFPERIKETRDIPSGERELLFYLPRWREKRGAYRNPFLNGLHWRANSSVSDSTVRLADGYLRDWQNTVATRSPEFHFPGGVIPILLSSACRAASSLSALRFLYRRVKSMKMPDRDLIWGAATRRAQETGWPHDLFTWLSRLERDGFERMSPEGARNYVALLSLFLGSLDHPLRNKATEALVAIGERFPAALFSHALDTLDFDDIYYPERMLAACYGVAMARWSDPEAKEFRAKFPQFARAVVKNIFMPGGRLLTHHALVRDYALGIADIARRLGVKFTKSQKAHMSPPFSAVPSPFPPVSALGKAEDDHLWGSHDFKKYAIGGLYGMGMSYYETPKFIAALRQVKWRAKNLGYDEEKFNQWERWMGGIGHHPEYGKVDSHREKYLQIAYYEKFGQQGAEGKWPEWISKSPNGLRMACGVTDVSFPAAPPEWDPEFKDIPMEGGDLCWIASGPEPDYGRLLELDNLGGASGPWVMLEGFVVHKSKDEKREMFSFLRGLMVRESDIPRLRAALGACSYPGNDEIPRCAENDNVFSVFSGEIPWSPEFAHSQAEADEDMAFGMVPAGTTAIHNIWSSEIWPAPDICAKLRLSRRGRGNDLFDEHGRTASTYRTEAKRAEFNLLAKRPANYFKFLHLRKDLLDEYLRATDKRLVWIVWGERRLLQDWRNLKDVSPKIKSAMRNYLHIHKRLIVYPK